MVNVEQIEIDLTIPTNEVSIVSMQPHLNLIEDEPFKLNDETIESQLEGINRTLELARDSFNARSAHFTIFPEYSIPGIEGIEFIDNEINSENWSNGSVIFAGVHGLTKEEYNDICDEYDVTVSEENNIENVPNTEWVNSCFIWVKEDNGDVKRFIQLKIRPSWPENDVTCHDMFSGSTIYVFKSRYDNEVPCRFSTFICFDWVAVNNGRSVRDEMLQDLQEQSENEVPIHWIFVVQHNSSPNHTTFLNSTVEFLTDLNKYPLVQRNDTVVLHCNTTPSKKPLKPSSSVNGAFTACITGPSEKMDLRGCRPTVCMQTNQYRGSDILKDAQCKDVVFREMGECIHRFQIRVPRFLGAGAATRTHLIEHAEVHAVNDNQDPRLSGNAIPASLKWLNDSLERIDSLAKASLEECSLLDEAKDLHANLVTNMSLTEPKKIEHQINWSACFKANDKEIRKKARRQNPDFWDLDDRIEEQALEHTVHTLSNLGLAFTINVKDTLLHGTLSTEDKKIEVVAIRGESLQDCCKHYNDNVPKNGNDPILVVIRDKNNLKPTERELSKYYESSTETGFKYLDYQTLVSLSREVENAEQLKEKTYEYLPGDRKII